MIFTKRNIFSFHKCERHTRYLRPKLQNFFHR